jgi:peptide/nickel transport system ATP-binding protein
LEPLLEVRDLEIAVRTDEGEFVAVDGVSFHVDKKEAVGIVGESGCGKSLTSLALMRLPGKQAAIKSGRIRFNGRNLHALSDAECRSIRGNEMAMIFQEPMTSLNPVLTIGDQLMEPLRVHLRMNRKDARAKAVQLLEQVGIPRPAQILREYPDALSGGMRQRVMIAMALACNPSLLIADEPTTALDVTIQAQILDLLRQLQQQSDMAILLITHDLGVIAEMVDRVLVMYAGQFVEEADVFTLFARPKHPYTQGLLASIPNVSDDRRQRLASIPGSVPVISQMPAGCRFHPRCPYATEQCRQEPPPLIPAGEHHRVRCWLAQTDERPAAAMEEWRDTDAGA